LRGPAYGDRVRHTDEGEVEATVKDIFGIADRYCDSAALHVAHRYGIFDLLTEARTADDLASALGWQGRKTAILLHALVALGLLQKHGVKFCNTPGTSSALVRESPDYIGDLIEHERLQWALWGRLDEVLASEGPIDGQQDVRFATDGEANDVFHRAMAQLSNDLVDRVVELDCWNDKRLVIDLAGGHGRYLARILQRLPEGKGEVWDVASARIHAERMFRDHSVESRASFREKNILDPASFDGVEADGLLLNHCLHHFNASEMRLVLANAVSMLRPQGAITILDVDLSSDRVTPHENAMFSLYMMVNVSNGEVHPTQEIADHLSSLGCDVALERLDNLEDDFLLVGRKR
jgi:SAM-dependent methyltransferase